MSIRSLSRNELQVLHDGTMEILGTVGVAFNHEEALSLFRGQGFKVEGRKVTFTEKQVRKALESVPASFTIQARNPEHNVLVGEEGMVCAPGYGSPFVTDAAGRQRSAGLEDYESFCKLVHTSPYLDMNGFMMVEPSDVPASTAHLHMLRAGILLSDKAFMGSPVSAEGARDALEMAGIVFGGREKLRGRPVMISLINSLSPLQFAPEMCGALIEFARYGQPCIVAPLMMAGASGPVELPGLLALQNAEILAGITLSQLAGPGCPAVYGSTSSATDMMTGGLAIGSPETSVIIEATAQMARYYGIPSRAGGALTNAHVPDCQAGAESALTLLTAARSGIHYILHACGILGSYLSMSFEKFLIDEELCGMVKHILHSPEIRKESVDLQTIKEVGIGGNYLAHEKTLELCRTAFFPSRLMYRDSFEAWKASGGPDAGRRAESALQQRLDAYRRPPIDQGAEQALDEYVGGKTG
jgi:trimethylamine--corrinoid protein Co-methyltransferase